MYFLYVPFALLTNSLHVLLSFCSLTHSVSVFAVGLRFLYWPQCRVYESRNGVFKEDPALFIEGPKYKDIKEEVLESGKSSLFAFNVVAAKCSELMLCSKTRKITASFSG